MKTVLLHLLDFALSVIGLGLLMKFWNTDLWYLWGVVGFVCIRLQPHRCPEGVTHR